MDLTALWVGDSFTRGEGAGVPPERTYPLLVGARLGWTSHVDAQDGTGFVNDGFLAGPGLDVLMGRLPATIRRVPAADLVIVDGGRNDAGTPAPPLRRAIGGYLGAVRAAYPSARLVVVLPTLLDRHQPPEYRDVSRVLREVAREHGAAVVDPAGVDGFAAPDGGTGASLVCFDGFHPSAAGQAHYADVLTGLLGSLVSGQEG